MQPVIFRLMCCEIIYYHHGHNRDDHDRHGLCDACVHSCDLCPRNNASHKT